MNKSQKIIVFLVLFNIVSLALVIYRYEGLLSKQKGELLMTPVKDGAPTKSNYTADEIIALIKKSNEYLGDSITILDNGKIISDNSKFGGTLNAVMNSPVNMELVTSNTAENRLPVQYNIYILAAAFYRDQYKQEFLK